MSISLLATLFLSHIICEIVDKSEEFTKKNKIMNTNLIGVPSLFIVSFYILSLLETTSDADIWAVNFKALDNKSLSSLNTGNGNETLDALLPVLVAELVRGLRPVIAEDVRS